MARCCADLFHCPPPFQQILNAEREALKRICEEIALSQEVGLDLGAGSGDSLHALPTMKRILLDASFSMLARVTGKTKAAYFQIIRRSRTFMQSQWLVCNAESTLAF